MTSLELKEARISLGFSQKKLATVLGVHRLSVLRWEANTHKIPHMLELALKQLVHEKRPRRRKRLRISAESCPESFPRQLEFPFVRKQLEFSTALSSHVEKLLGNRSAPCDAHCAIRETGKARRARPRREERTP
jgi:DNA-binding XRE family transcriptional regulator